MGDAYNEMIQVIRRQGAKFNGFDMEIAKVTSISPLSLMYNHTPITKGIYCEPAKMETTDLDGVFEESGINPVAVAYMKSRLMADRLSPGDFVVVQRVGDAFYIVERVVKQA